MTIGPVGSALALRLVTAPGQAPDPQLRRAQVNAQADLLQALRGTELPIKMVLARLADTPSVDLYL